MEIFFWELEGAKKAYLLHNFKFHLCAEIVQNEVLIYYIENALCHAKT